jgi:hypothetical protein
VIIWQQSPRKAGFSGFEGVSRGREIADAGKMQSGHDFSLQPTNKYIKTLHKSKQFGNTLKLKANQRRG